MKNPPSSFVIAALCWCGAGLILLPIFFIDNSILRYLIMLCGIFVGYSGYYLAESSIFSVGFYKYKNKDGRK